MKRNGILAGLAVAITICGIGVVPSSTQAAAGPKAATLAYVDKAKLPIVRQVIKAFRNASPARKSITRHTDQLPPLSHRNVTRILVELPARVAFGRGGRGGYEIAADFRGPIKPKNALSVGVAAGFNGGAGYGFLLGRTTRDGATSPSPLHWFLGVYRGYSVESFDSCSIYGGEGGFQPILSKPILSAALKQARAVIRRAVKRRPIQWQRDVVSWRPPARTCSK